MAELQDYESGGEIQFNNSTLAEATSVQVETSSNKKPVTTIKKGFAGGAAGAAMTRITVENAVPKAGLEAEFIALCQAGTECTVLRYLAGQRYSYNGYIESVSEQGNVDNAASLSFTMMAGPAKIL